MRGQLAEEPFARSAVWTRRLAIAGGLLALAAVLLPRHGALDAARALLLLAVGLGAALLALPCGLWAAVVIWRTGWRGTGRFFTGLCIAAVTLAYPGYLACMAFRQPPSADASTDPADPPRFSTSTKALAARNGATPGDAAWFDFGRAAQIDAQSVLMGSPAPQAFAAALQSVKILRWHVIEAAAPVGRAGAGHIDAVAQSAVMRLPEDIAIRFVPADGQIRVDIRSASRLGGLPLVGDDNARNVQAFTEELENLAGDN